MTVAMLMVQLGSNVSGNAQTPAEAPASPPAPLKLSEAPERFKALSDELAAGIASLRQKVDEEAAAGRITDAAAQSIRWTLRSTGREIIRDFRLITEAVRIPVDNTRLQAAFKELEQLNGSLQMRKNTLLTEIQEELQRQTSAAIRTSQNPQEIAALANLSQSLEHVAQRANDSTNYGRDILTLSSSVLNQLERVVAATKASDLPSISMALNNLAQHGQLTGQITYQADVDARVKATLEPYQQAATQAQEKLQAALEKREPLAKSPHAT